MLLSQILLENFQLYTRDDRGNWLTQGVDEIMADPQSDKTILKQSPSSRRYGEQPSLTVYPEFIEIEREFSLVLSDDHAWVSETYPGESIPVIRFLLSRWPEYGEFTLESSGKALQDIAAQDIPAMRKQEFWYHGTTTNALPDIQRLGLMPRDVNQRNYRGLGGSEKGLVYLAANSDDSRMHAENAAQQFGGAPVLLKIDLSGLEAGIVDDHDVRFTTLGKGGYDSGDRTTDRIRNRGGEASYRAIQTIAYKGRIPPTRIEVIWQGTEKKGRVQRRSDHYEFVDKLSALAKQLNKDQLYEFFHIVGAPPSGWTGSQVKYSDIFYTEPEKLINTIYSRRSQPKQFARWINGMRLRSAKWRNSQKRWYKDDIGSVLKLIDEQYQDLLDPNRA